MEHEIFVSSDADSKRVFEMLMEYNRRYMHDFKDYNFHIEEDGEIIGGIVAWSVSDTLEIEYLRIADHHRKEGLGTKLLRHVEEPGPQRRTQTDPAVYPQLPGAGIL